MSEASSAHKLFTNFGLDEKTVDQAVKSDKVRKLLLEVIQESGLTHADKSIGNLLYQVATTVPTSAPIALENRAVLVRYVVDRRVRSIPQVEGAVKYFKKALTFNQTDFDESCGAGIEITPQQMTDAIQKAFDQHADELKQQRYRIAGKLIASINQALKWADGQVLKRLFDERLEKELGPRTAEDDAKPTKTPKEKEKDNAKQVRAEKSAASSSSTSTNSSSSSSSSSSSASSSDLEEAEFFGEGRDLPEAHNTEEQMRGHLAVTKGKMLTRFPPEPNGFLHLGHAKAMNFNFGIAKRSGGSTIMRFDDTNPEAEKQIYIDNILENVAWLGHQQCKTTYSSDYFPELYELAVKLIRKGKAYVDHQKAEEIKEYRKLKKASPWRDRPIDENLRLFEDMRKGKFEEGAATLRLKADLNSPNPQIAGDIVAYRIKYTPHPHAGDKWCIYPSYDYTHCIIDSLENITHSLCTLEFEVRRESYYWLLHELDLYKPKVWEYSRLNLEYNVMSKRRLLKLVVDGYVRGWDDPRLLTLNGLRRRGYTPEAINEFCRLVGVTRNENTIPAVLLEHCLRQDLEVRAKRAMVVEQPVEVILTNWPNDKIEMCNAPDFPKDESRGFHQVPLTRIVYIDANDIRLKDDKDYFGMAPGKTVHLKYAYNITCDRIETGVDGKPIRVHATVDTTNSTKVKGNLHWVAQPRPGVEPLKVELRLYDYLFKSPDPMELDNWIDDLNPDSIRIVKGAYAEPNLAKVKPGDKFQFERVAFFVCDPDTTADNIVFNRTVALKEAKTKPTAAKNAAPKPKKKKELENLDLE